MTCFLLGNKQSDYYRKSQMPWNMIALFGYGFDGFVSAACSLTGKYYEKIDWFEEQRNYYWWHLENIWIHPEMRNIDNGSWFICYDFSL